MQLINTNYAMRPFEETDDDYQTIVRIANTIYPDDASTVEEVKHWDSTRTKDAKYPFHRVLIANEMGQVLGYGEYMQHQSMYHPQKYFWELFVDVGQDVATVANAFHNYVLEQLADKNLIALISVAREDKTEHVAFLEQAGYQKLMRYQQSHIELDTFDASRFDDDVTRVKESGIRIITLAQLREEKPDEWQNILYEMDWELGKDVPNPDERHKKTLEEFVQGRLENPALLPEGWFIAVDGDSYVGMSNLWKDLANPEERLWTGLTGVSRSHRRRGIATALKVHALQFARTQGVKTVQTDNEENNPMYQLNVQLGFTPLPAWVDFEKTFKES